MHFSNKMVYTVQLLKHSNILVLKLSLILSSPAAAMELEFHLNQAQFKQLCTTTDSILLEIWEVIVRWWWWWLLLLLLLLLLLFAVYCLLLTRHINNKELNWIELNWIIIIIIYLTLHRSAVHIRYRTCHKKPLYNNKRTAESRQNVICWRTWKWTYKIMFSYI
jgi:hypothetical protein